MTIRRVLLVLAAALAPTMALATPANAAIGWTDYACTDIHYLSGNYVEFAKGTICVQLFNPTNTAGLAQSTATRTRCSIRNEDTSIISGVEVTTCAIGINGNTINDNTTGAFDNGTCCANLWSFIHNVKYDPDGYYLRGRGDLCWRSIAFGRIFCSRELSQVTGTDWLLT